MLVSRYIYEEVTWKQLFPPPFLRKIPYPWLRHAAFLPAAASPNLALNSQLLAGWHLATLPQV